MRKKIISPAAIKLKSNSCSLKATTLFFNGTLGRLGKTLLTLHRWQMLQTKREKSEEIKQVLFLIAGGIMLLWEKPAWVKNSGPPSSFQRRRQWSSGAGWWASLRINSCLQAQKEPHMSCPIWEHEKIFSRVSGNIKTTPDEKVEVGWAAFSAHKLLSGEGGAVTCL